MTAMLSRLALATALGVSATALAAEPAQFTPRSDTAIAANTRGPIDDPNVVHRNASNWPALPERHGAQEYRKLIITTSGVRERNFESGRR